MMFCTDNTVLLLNFSSLSNRSLIMFSAGSMGIDVKSEVTSYDDRHSPSWRVNFWAFDTKSPVLCIWWGGFTYQWFEDLTNDLGHPIGN